jgi:predicted adenine nucleotide alpha hydrolase (AANH) superfamily ATPase
METYNVRAYAVDWCGYESHYQIHAESEDKAREIACQNLIDEYDLVEYQDGEYGEMEDFDEDGEPLEDSELTTISASICWDEE